MNRHLYKTFFFSVLLATVVSSVAASDIDILSSSNTEFRFRLTVQTADLDCIVGDDSTAVYATSVKIGIPFGSQVSLTRVEGLSFSALDNDLLKIPAAKNLPLVTLSQPIQVRGRQIVAINVYPVTPEGQYESVEVGVTFSGGLTSGPISSRDGHFDRIFGRVLANYESFKHWPVPARATAKMAGVASGPFSDASNWYKIGVNQTGLIKVTGAQLEGAGLVLSALDSDDIHLYNGGGKAIPADNAEARPEFREVAIIVNDGSDGQFDRGDHILFFGEHVNRWSRQPVDTFMTSSYADHNVYWLTVENSLGGAGLRMTQVDVAPDGVYDTLVTEFSRKAYAEQDNLLRKYRDGKIFDYYKWYWANDSAITLYMNTPGVVQSDTALVVLRGRSFNPSDFTVNGVAGFSRGYDDMTCTYRTLNLNSGLNKIHSAFLGQTSVLPYFDNITIRYNSVIQPSGNKLDLPLGDFYGEARIVAVDQFSATPYLFNINDPQRPVQLVGYERSGDITFETDLAATGGNRFFFGTESSASVPTYVTAATPTDLRTALTQTDLIIVTDRQFVEALNEYIAYRENSGYTIHVVSVDDIMDNFSWGLYDPLAIRDFLKYAYETYPSPAPYAVLFVGDGNYDCLNHLGLDADNFVPPFINPIDVPTSSSDDNYVYFGRYGIFDSDSSYMSPDRGFDMMTARWPVDDVADIATITDKIKRYESADNYGSWRLNLSLVADDENGDNTVEVEHVEDSEVLAKYHVPAFLNQHKIYLWDYPLVNGERPDVNEAIINRVNNGVLVINYVGHGNPNVWAHEHVFRRMEDIPRLNNYDRLPLFYVASCAIGFFDDPGRDGMAEVLLTDPTGGAIATISATLLVYSSPNHDLNVAIFDELFYDDSLTICEAVFAAKLGRQYLDPVTIVPNRNDRAFQFFGDPLLQLGLPRHKIEFDQSPSSLTALKTARVSGQIVDAEGTPVIGDGTIYAEVYDSNREKLHRIINDFGSVIDSVSYELTGPTIFRGKASVVGGHFDFEFIPPLDIGYGGSGARISVYASLAGVDGAGVVDSIEIADTIAVFADSVGPEITCAVGDKENFVSGDIIASGDALRLTFSDSSGLNLAAGIGHGIMLTIDGMTESRINLTPLFEYDQDDYTTGSLTYTPVDLSPGLHSFRVVAWDNANNPNMVEFSAEVVTSSSLAINDLLNYPNPMADSTRFSFVLTQSVESLRLEIFTLSGKKIKSFHQYSMTPAYYDDIVWYGRDDDGDRVATGVYLYRASARPVSGGDPVEEFGKIVVIN